MLDPHKKKIIWALEISPLKITLYFFNTAVGLLLFDVATDIYNAFRVYFECFCHEEQWRHYNLISIVFMFITLIKVERTHMKTHVYQ